MGKFFKLLQTNIFINIYRWHYLCEIASLKRCRNSMTFLSLMFISFYINCALLIVMYKSLILFYNVLSIGYRSRSERCKKRCVNKNKDNVPRLATGKMYENMRLRQSPVYFFSLVNGQLSFQKDAQKKQRSRKQLTRRLKALHAGGQGLRTTVLGDV